MLTYRLVGVKDESSKGKDHFEDRKMDEIDLFNSRLPPFGGDDPDKPPTLSKILSADTPQGKAYLQERLDSSGSETWRQFFFNTLERTATRLEIYEDAKNAREDMMMRNMCVKMIMHEPEPTMMLPGDTISLSKSPSEERRGKVSVAAAKCRKVLSLKGDVSLCSLFSGTRADVYTELHKDQYIPVDSDIVEIRRPFAFEMSIEARKKTKKKIRRHPGYLYVIIFESCCHRNILSLELLNSKKNLHRKYYRHRQRLTPKIRTPVYWLVTTARTKDRSDVDGAWKSLVKNEPNKIFRLENEKFKLLST